MLVKGTSKKNCLKHLAMHRNPSIMNINFYFHFKSFRFSLLVSIIFCFIVQGNSFSQDCLVKFEATAGPDIDVCSGGQVNLSGMIGGDATEVIWEGGIGKVEPDRKSLAIHYTPAESETKMVVLTMSAFNSKYQQCVPAKSTMTIRIHKEPHVNAGNDQNVVFGNSVSLNGNLTGDALELTWKTKGTGTFKDDHQLNTIYFPSKGDFENGYCSLMLSAYPFPGCPPDASSIGIKIKKNKGNIND